MISINNLTVAYGSFTLLDSVSFSISENDKIGLVGKNGAGKSTIMKIICGLQSPSSGQIDIPSHIRIGYLPQLMETHKGKTVLQETMTAFESLLAIEREIDDATLQLSLRTDYESDDYIELINRVNELHDCLNVSKDEPLETQAKRTLKGLGFRENEFDRDTGTFSQGWNMRIELAKILLSKPDLLLLDEPTNHLDIESIEWLEDYLKNCKCSLMMVSHDRKFLDNVTNRTVELMLGHLNDYKVPYSQYTVLRAERIAQQTAAYENQQRMIEKTEDFIERFRYKPTKSNQVQSRIKALEKLDIIEIEQTDASALSVKFPPSPRSGDVVFKATDLTVGYPQKVVFRNADVELKRGERVALVGRNGEGKTTLMRVLMGQLEPISGEVRLGHNVSIGYFAQNQEDVLDKSDTVFSTLERIATGEVRTKLRGILGAFLFKGDDIDKRVSVLSGGERARLGMAKLMLQSHNLLALDEPTNHMDIQSKDVLKQALLSYDGTLLIVSHDRDFLDGLVDKIYEFENGRVREHLGSVSEFLQKRKLESLNELERKLEVEIKPESLKSKVSAKEDFEKMKQQSRQEKKLRDRIAALERDIENLEAKLKTIEDELSVMTEHEAVMKLTSDYLKCKEDLDAKTEEWGSLI